MSETPSDEEQPTGGKPRRGLGIGEWIALAAVVGFLIYRMFFGGPC